MGRHVKVAERRADAHAARAELLRLTDGADEVTAEAARALLERADQAYAGSTAYEYDLVVADFIRFACGVGVNTWDPPDAVLATWFAAKRERMVWHSVQRHRLALVDAFLRRGLPDPTLRPLVATTIASLAKDARGNHYVRRPLLVADYLAMLEPISTERLIDLRDRVALGLGYAGLATVAEVRSARVERTFFTPRGLVTEFFTRGRARKATIGKVGRGDVVDDVREWIQRTGLAEGPLVREVRQNGVVPPGAVPISLFSLGRILRERLSAANIDPAFHPWSSLRLGYLASANVRNVDELELAIAAGYSGVNALREALKRIDAHGTPLLAARIVPEIHTP